MQSGEVHRYAVPESVYCSVSRDEWLLPTGEMPTRRNAMADKAFTHKTAENAKPGVKPCKLCTGCGVYLLVVPTGGKLWRHDCRLDGTRRTAALGSFPAVFLKEAAEKQAACRKLIEQGIAPVAEKNRATKGAEEHRRSPYRGPEGHFRGKLTGDNAHARAKERPPGESGHWLQGGRWSVLLAGEPKTNSPKGKNNQDDGNARVHRSTLQTSPAANPTARIPAMSAKGLLS